MTSPQPNQFEPSREQVDKVAFEVCIMTPNEMAKWHLTELHRETEKLRGENERLKAESASFKSVVDTDMVRDSRALQQQLAAANESLKGSNASCDAYKTERDTLRVQLGNCTVNRDGFEALLDKAEKRILELESKCGEKDKALKLCDENEAYHQAVQDAKDASEKCDKQGDMYGYNFYQGIYHGIIQRQMLLTTEVRAALTTEAKG